MDATELAYAGIARQAEVIADGEVSSRELVELSRIVLAVALLAWRRDTARQSAA